MRRTALVAITAVSVLLFFGCTARVPQPPDSTSSRPTDARGQDGRPGVCTLITAAELSRFLGQELTSTNGDLDHSICHYYAGQADRQGKSSFGVALVSTTDGKQVAAAAGFTADQAVHGIGDGAWYVDREPARLFILEGDTYLRMSGEGGLEAAGRSIDLTVEQFRPIAELVAGRL